MSDSIGYKQTEEILYQGAEVVRDAIKERAQTGPTGNLKRSPIAKKMPPSKVPVAIAGIDRKIAPHAHLIEFGTTKMPAHPFFRPAWDATRDKVNRELAEKLGKKVEGAVK